MKPTILIFCLFTLVPGLALADSYFQSQDISSLRLTDINLTEKSVEVTDSIGQRQRVGIGDTIANTRAIIIKINAASITLKTKKGQTKIPVIGGGSAGHYSASFH